jgi:AcrR family transcriptional regulator
MAAARPSARDRMILSAAVLVREQGARATSIDDVLAHSGAPRGSVYHHFPGGRDELLREATAFAGEVVDRRLQAAAAADPTAVLDELVALYRDELLATDFRAGCPVMAVAIEAREDESGVQEQAGAAFTRWTATLAGALERAGVAPARAARLACLILAAFEGALAMSRSQRDLAPLDDVHAELAALLERERGTP